MLKKRAEIEIWLNEMGIDSPWTINDNLTVDVDGSVDLSNQGLVEIPIQFGKVSGDFICSNNNLTSLKGCPKVVEEDYFCNDNQLTTLKGAPEIIEDSFYCERNNLLSLEGAPNQIKGNFYCAENSLTNLKGGPEYVGVVYYLKNNPIKSFEFLPINVKVKFSHNGITEKNIPPDATLDEIRKINSILKLKENIEDGLYSSEKEIKRNKI